MKNKLFCICLIMIFLFTVYFMPSAYAEDSLINYKIKTGDTLYNLSIRFKTTTKNILQLNPTINSDNLTIGNTIKIEHGNNVKLYKVKFKDTLWKIAQKFNISINSIIDTNFIKQPDLIYPNDILVIPKTENVKLYFIKNFGVDFYLVPEIREITITQNKYINVLEQLIKGSENSDDLYMPIPKETKVLGVTIKNQIAYPNFSEELYNCNVGAIGEQLTLFSIVNTLTQFDEIKQVYPLVNGNPIESLAGHVLVSEPLKPNEQFIKE